MALISHAIPNLFNGISQQAAALRLPSQAELQENAYSTIVDGLQKRYPLVHSAILSVTGDYSTALVKVLNYSATEKYVLFLNGTTIKVFDIDGTEKTVNTPDGVSYLSTTDSYKNMQMVTVADYTFITNKTKVTAMGSTTAAETPTGVVWVKTGRADTDYTVNVNGNIVTHTSGGTGAPATWKTNAIAAALVTLINAIGGYTATQDGSNIKIVQNSGLDFDLATSDSYGDQALKAIKGSVQKFSDLPAKFFENVTVAIEGESENQFDSMYVKWVAGADNTTGVWKETVKPQQKDSFNLATMPHQLVREPDGTFTFEVGEWGARSIGDDVIAPAPSFIGSTVNQVFFYKNRLGFLSEENVILSRNGEYYNFFPETATEVLDTDPIDIAASNTKISILEYAVPFDESLLLFSARTQFVLTDEELLTPNTVSINVVTEFEASNKVMPVAAGQNLYFPVEKNNFSGMREYYVDSELVSHDAADITAHCPYYLPGNIYQMASSSNEDLLLVVSADEPNAVYCYKYYWGGDEKIQSAWFKWVFDVGDTVLGMDIVGTEVIFVIERDDDVYVDIMNLGAGQVDTGLGYLVLLDRKVYLTGSYDSGTNTTTWTLPYAYAGTVEAVTSGDFGTNGGRILNIEHPTSTTVTATGDYSGGQTIIGIPYTMRYRFSEQFVKDSQNSAIITSKLQMRNLFLSFINTGYFRVEVSTPWSPVYSYQFTGKVIGSGSMILGQPNVEDGTFRAPLMADSRDIQIDLVNDSSMPCQFQSAEWEAMYSIRNRRT